MQQTDRQKYFSESIEGIVNKNPDLTANGFNTRHCLKKCAQLRAESEIEEMFSEYRKALISSEKEFWFCVDFLKNLREKKQKYHHSYRMKHVIENVMGGYVANGTLIAAAIHSGLKLRKFKDSPNADIRIPAVSDTSSIMVVP